MKIVGICLIKNEDLYIEMIIKNILDFCDEIIVLENHSHDETYKIVKNLSIQYPKIKLIQINDPLDTHRFIEPYVGTDTWVFRVDGDELYDSKGLSILRNELLAGKYRDWWVITSSTIHVEDINNKTRACGYEGRMSALSNFSLLVSWNEKKSERLHGVHKVYKNTFDKKNMKLIINGTENFETSYVRCLHLCFVLRSSLSNKSKKRNPSERKHWVSLMFNLFKNIKKGTFLKGISYKDHAYRIGSKRCVDISSFFSS